MAAIGETATAQPLISFIIATKNAAQPLTSCITNLRRATFPIQIIVKDACSSDSTTAVAQALCTTSDSVISMPDSGIYQAWNQALPHASGKFVAFIGADDNPNMAWYERHLSTLHVENSVDIFYGDLVKTLFNRYRTHVTPELTEINTINLGRFWLPHPGLLHRRHLFSNANFSERYKLSGDYEYFLRQVSRTGPISARKLKGIQCLMGADGLSHQPRAFGQYIAEFRDIRQRLNVLIDNPSGLAKLLFHLHQLNPRLAATARAVSWQLRASSRAPQL